jgi:hypothetical protein
MTTRHIARFPLIASLAAALALISGSLISGATTPLKPVWTSATVAQGAVNVEGLADPASVSCSSVGNCSVLGTYSVSGGNDDFLFNEVNGKWVTPTEVATSLNVDSDSNAGQVSCGAVGDCALGGSYGNDGILPFVQLEFNGHWLSAAETAASLNTKDDGEVQAVSCWGPADCAAEGAYKNSSGTSIFVVSSTNGKWGTAQTIAATLNTNDDVMPDGVSCTGAGDCTAVGQYSISTMNDLRGMFGDTETNGKWGPAIQIAPTITADHYPNLAAVSCAVPGDCLAVGNDGVPFGVTETGGKWAAPETLAASIDPHNNASVSSVSCPAPGDCTVGGTAQGGTVPFVQSESAGKWGLARGIGVVPTQDYGAVEAVSCWAPGDCAATGDYDTSITPSNGFVDTSTNNSWVNAQEVTGAESSGGQAGDGYRVDCLAGGFCAVTGVYDDGTDFAYAATHQGELKLALSGLSGTHRVGTKVAVTVSAVAPGSIVTLTRVLGKIKQVTNEAAQGSSVVFSVIFKSAGTWKVTASAKGVECITVPASGTAKAA